jgi:acyl transferase domain-containing protein/NAD(P)H-dependent flavin oxidoreductase YrpB (nitropropane dioxygenase family)/NAD(P)-dependent dehydrogenase (short-subunit alcohol dehydrogenase family)
MRDSALLSNASRIHVLSETYLKPNMKEIIGVTPFEQPDVALLQALSQSGIFPVLSTGRNRADAEEALLRAAQQTASFGVYITSDRLRGMVLPDAAGTVLLPYGISFDYSGRRWISIVTDLASALRARDEGADGLIIKGNEAGGVIGSESSFILFQRVIREVRDIPVWVMGGVGLHTAPAVMALGGAGVVLDNQLALFPECGAPRELKEVLSKLSGTETRVFDSFRVLVRPNSPEWPQTPDTLDAVLAGIDPAQHLLPLGQDIALAADYVTQYKKLGRFAFALREAMTGHIRQAQHLDVVRPGNPLADELGITYPIAQGPMTRVSDVPAFAAAVAEAGALPFVALSLLKGEKARELVLETGRQAGARTWGVGILGFAPPELRAEQLDYVLEAKPPVVLIAGGRPSQAKPLEKAGIKTFLHVPSAALLDLFLKEGARRFVFEGRECGGHVGPLSSFVLWEKQIERLLEEDQPGDISVFFAGGIHDSVSAALVAVMAAPLAARGVKVGVLMGTAYLYTKEAVETGAILPGFQEKAMAAADTVLLETAPGHETRCLDSPFASFFNEEKNRMLREGLDRKEIWEKLESLNVGRLRIAAKGIERQGDSLLSIDESDQQQRGMYMIGQVAALRSSVVSMEDLHREVSEGNYPLIRQASVPQAPEEKDRSLDVAIIGMACIFPGARNLDEYWQNILLGKDAVTEVPDERWNKDLYYQPDREGSDLSHSKWGGFIPRIDFDPLEFGIPPQSLAAIEPTQLLSLLVAKRAMEDAGYTDKGFDTEAVSVIIGAEGGNDLANSYSFRGYYKQVHGGLPAELDAALPDTTEDSFPGILANVIAGRITNRLNLGGRNYTVDAACASSLAAVDLACQELFLGKSDMVLAGGADLHNGINDYLMFSSTHALSRKGRCATFDSEADGIALGEGIAMLVLKRKEDAERDGDRIYSVIRGVGGSSDGKSLGLTAPRKNGQVSALERAYTQAGISPAQLGLVEAHGTGTVVGDRTELSALTDLLTRSGAVAGQTHLGSVKTQIGHTKCAAGLAGLIKASLSVYHGIKPATLHLRQPNAYYRPGQSPFAFQAEAGIWPEERRFAGISAFGFGGTNFHAVIESGSRPAAGQPAVNAWPAELIVLRGDTDEQALVRARQVRELLDTNDSLPLRDIAYSLAQESTAPVRASIVATSTEDLKEKIDLLLAGGSGKGLYRTSPKEGKVAFLFPGQGSQRVNMARQLFVLFPEMRELLNKHPEYLPILFPDAVFDEAAAKAQKEAIRDTRMAQPLLGIVDLAIARFLQSLGIEPDMVAGHSYGELPALAFAGAFDDADLVSLSARRAESILRSVEGSGDTGAMIAVNAPVDELKKALAEVTDVYPVNFNSPQQCVVAGTTPAIERASEILREAKISFRRLEVACAFHSPVVGRSREIFLEVLGEISFRETQVPVWSNTTAAPYPSDADGIRQRLADHLVEPVYFTRELEEMYAGGARIFVEVGPGKVLSGLAKATLGKDEILLHTEESGQLVHLLQTLAAYLATGRSLHLSKLFEGRQARQLFIDQPSTYRKSPATWYVNGHYARPATGNLPANGALPIIQPIALPQAVAPAVAPAPAGGAEQLMYQYLESMNQLVQAQRDVMMTFLGQFQGMAPMVMKVTGTTVVPAPQAPVKAAPAQTTAVVAPERPKAKDLRALLLGIVSDKTGYPAEMLGMDMDLEADLSIDSIKRIEIIGTLRTELGGLNRGDEDAAMEQLSRIKTLNGLVRWLEENAAATAPDPVATVVSETPVSSEKRTAAELQRLIRGVVSEKTGYPEEMLGMDLDLEADLSIDSIKRMEILGALKGQLGLNGTQGDDHMEKLAALKTLQGLVDWLLESDATGTDSVAIPVAIPETAVPEALSRHRFERRPAAGVPGGSLAGQRFAITADSAGYAEAIRQSLEQQGASADILTEEADLQEYQGLILLNLFAAGKKAAIIDYFSLIKRLDFNAVRWVYLFSDTTSHLQEYTDPLDLRHYQGYSGFFKSLDKEYEQTKFRIVSVDAGRTPESVAGIAVQELRQRDEPSEIIYEGNKRFINIPVPSRLAAGRTSIELEKDSVVLVLGGAQGITAELMIHFAREYPCTYILVGRSENPAGGTNGASLLKTKEEIRQYLVKRGDLRTPAAIEQETSRIHKANQILQTLHALEATGSKVVYESLDLRDEAALGRLIAGIYEQYGRIDGVVHGAGLLEDKLFQSKTPESFKRVFDTKVNPLRILAEQLRPDTRFVVLFSSIASVYGNRGQTDYAAANSVMDLYARALRRKINGKVTAINWGPWKGAGMVSPSLEKEYERRGIALIPLQDGKETFLNEMKYGNESQVLIMAGDNW